MMKSSFQHPYTLCAIYLVTQHVDITFEKTILGMTHFEVCPATATSAYSNQAPFCLQSSIYAMDLNNSLQNTVCLHLTEVPQTDVNVANG